MAGQGARLQPCSHLAGVCRSPPSRHHFWLSPAPATAATTPFVGFGEGDTPPSPAEARTGLPRLEQSARGHGLGPAAAQSQGEHPHAIAHAAWRGWQSPAALPHGHSWLWGKSRGGCSHCRHLPVPSPGAPRPLPAPVPAPPGLAGDEQLPLQKLPTPPGQAPPQPLPEAQLSLLIFN